MALPEGYRAQPVSQAAWNKWSEEFAVYDDAVGAEVRFFGFVELPDFTGAAATDQVVVVDDPAARLDRYAYQYLGDSALWWVIAAYNDMDVPEACLYKGLRLRIPSKAWVSANVLNKPRVQRRSSM